MPLLQFVLESAGSKFLLLRFVLMQFLVFHLINSLPEHDLRCRQAEGFGQCNVQFPRNTDG